MQTYETFRNIIEKIELDDQRYLKISKIEATFENAEIFLFSLFDKCKSTKINDKIQIRQTQIRGFCIIFVISSYKIKNNVLYLTHKMYIERKFPNIDQEVISIRKNKYKVDQHFKKIIVKPIKEKKFEFISAYKGIVEMCECDQMAHMNVQFYFEKHSKALQLFIKQVFSKNTSTKIISERCIFQREILKNDCIELIIFVKNINHNSIILLSKLYCISRKFVSAYFETIINFDDDPSKLAKRVFDFKKISQISYIQNIYFDNIRKLDDILTPSKPAKNSFLTCRKAVNTWDLDSNGNATSKFMISCVSDAATQFFTRCGADYNWRNNYKIGSAALDYFVRYYKSPKLGMALTLKSNFLHVGNKSFKFCHHLIDDSTNEIIMDIQIVAVLFDTEKRKAIEIPETFKKNSLNLIANNS